MGRLSASPIPTVSERRRRSATHSHPVETATPGSDQGGSTTVTAAVDAPSETAAMAPARARSQQRSTTRWRPAAPTRPRHTDAASTSNSACSSARITVCSAAGPGLAGSVSAGGIGGIGGPGRPPQPRPGDHGRRVVGCGAVVASAGSVGRSGPR